MTTTKLSANWEYEQDVEMKRELEEEIERERETIKMFDYDWYRPEWKGIRRDRMRRHHEHKLEKAEELYNEAVEKGWFDGVNGVAQAAQVIKDAGGMVVLPENRERFDAQLKELHNAEGARDEALAKVNKLTAAIEDMKLDCEGEVYEELLKIADVLGR